VRHRKEKRKLGRAPSHVRAMYSNMLASLIEHRRIKTTERKARDLRRIAEKAVTRFTSLGDLLLKDRSNLPAEDKAKVIHAMRMVSRTLRDRQAVLALYEDIAPRYLGRPGGYTRIYKTGFRRGDGAPLAILEFIDAELPEREGAKKSAAPKKKGLLGRLRRGKK
jgi:large subunit ribosomal protein L17